MAVIAIQDLRWGDTGKGKISEYLSHPDLCGSSVRSGGGGNAGHVVQRGTRKIALHLLPAGCLHEGVDIVLGRGMVTHLPTLLNEIGEVRAKFDTDPLKYLILSPENHILFHGHKEVDRMLEKRKGNDAVGTTGSGIGPAYADKANRIGMRMESLRHSPAVLKDGYGKLAKHWKDSYGVHLDDRQAAEDIDTLLLSKELLEGRLHDMTEYWRRTLMQIAKGKKRDIVLEGAQGSLLSIDAEGYPYVTSSATTVAGQLQGAGLPTRELTDVVGTLKAYDTRVGNGPMLTELSPEESAKLRDLGGERGSTTGRNRRTGWLDLKDTERRAFEEGVTQLAVLKGDILDSYSEIPLSIGTTNGKPDYATFPGWSGSIRGMRRWEDLPKEAKDMYQFMGDFTKVPLRFIGTGPESSELIVRA